MFVWPCFRHCRPYKTLLPKMPLLQNGSHWGSCSKSHNSKSQLQTNLFPFKDLHSNKALAFSLKLIKHRETFN